MESFKVEAQDGKVDSTAQWFGERGKESFLVLERERIFQDVEQHLTFRGNWLFKRRESKIVTPILICLSLKICRMLLVFAIFL